MKIMKFFIGIGMLSIVSYCLFFGRAPQQDAPVIKQAAVKPTQFKVYRPPAEDVQAPAPSEPAPKVEVPAAKPGPATFSITLEPTFDDDGKVPSQHPADPKPPKSPKP